MRSSCWRSLYEADRDWGHANEHFLVLVSAKGGANAMVLAYYIQALLRRQEGKEAAAWLQRLETLEPDSARTVGVKARVLSAQGQGEAAARLVEDFAEKTFKEKKNAAVLGNAASLLEELRRPVEAEKKYREYVKAVEVEQPERTLVLAAFLARQDRLTEALDVAEGVWAKCKPETAAATVVAALRVGRPTPQHFRRVERMLQDAITANPTATNLLVSLADLRDAEAQDAEAEKLYREVLTRNPRNPLALNNLAWLLAFQPAKAAQALELSDRRLAITGPNPSVLDTRGMVLLKLGRRRGGPIVLRRGGPEPDRRLLFPPRGGQKGRGPVERGREGVAEGQGVGLPENEPASAGTGAPGLRREMVRGGRNQVSDG